MKLLLIFVLCFSCLAHGQESEFSPSRSPIPMDFPLLDMPFQLSESGYGFPSMRQSLEFSTNFYLSGHALIGGEPGTEHTTGRIWGIAAFDFLTTWIPLGNAWLHEEWHRAVMSRRGISSFNDVYTFPIGQELIAVSRVEDKDLVNLKREHPEEQVRLSSAGMESQVVQNLHIEKKHFFDDVRTFDRILLWMNALNVSFYLSTCSSSSADESTNDQNKSDGSDVSKRDFTGLDCTAWVYDLFRPEEPYSARGVHPSNIGLDRYIKYSDLSDREKSFLKRQFTFSLFNFADPFLLGIQSFHGTFNGENFLWNAKASHSLTSFGGTVDLHLFLKNADHKFLIQLHNGFNDVSYFPGVSAEWIDHKLPWNGYSVSSKLTLWNQPRSQLVSTSGGELLVAGGIALQNRWSEHTSGLVGVESKTPGWIAGNVYMGSNTTFWAGIRTEMF